MPIRRARYPSSQSVIDARENTTAAQKPEDFEGDNKITAINGIAAILVMVRIFGRFSIAVEDIVQLA